jgi:hypothetical protein
MINRSNLSVEPDQAQPRQPECRFRGSETAAKRAFRSFQAEFEAGKIDPTTATVGDLLAVWLADVEPDKTPVPTPAGWTSNFVHHCLTSHAPFSRQA